MNEAREVLWYFEPQYPGAYQPGSFHHALMQAMARADHENMGKLILVFPALGRWFYAAKNIDGGLEDLKMHVEALDADRTEHQST